MVLELISDTNQMFIICNTHLISDPDGNSIKLLQALVELTIINQIKQNIKNDVSIKKKSYELKYFLHVQLPGDMHM